MIPVASEVYLSYAFTVSDFVKYRMMYQEPGANYVAAVMVQQYAGLIENMKLHSPPPKTCNNE